MSLVLSSAAARGAKGSNELIKETLSEIGIDSKGFSTRSLRAGGATFIAKNLPKSDGSDRLLMLHGRWRYKQAKNIFSLVLGSSSLLPHCLAYFLLV